MSSSSISSRVCPRALKCRSCAVPSRITSGFDEAVVGRACAVCAKRLEQSSRPKTPAQLNVYIRESRTFFNAVRRKKQVLRSAQDDNTDDNTMVMVQA